MKIVTIAGIKVTVLLAVCLFFMSACTVISKFDQHAYENATSLKAESLDLLGKAAEPYSRHQPKAEHLQLKLKKAYEYAKGLDLNEDSMEQWAIISDPGSHSIAGVLQRWQKNKTLNPDFILFSREKIAQGFDEVIKLEAAKHKQSYLQ